MANSCSTKEPLSTNGVQWTPTRIRSALKYPKPIRAIAKAHAFDRGESLRPSRATHDELRLQQQFADNANLLAAAATRRGAQ